MLLRVVVVSYTLLRRVALCWSVLECVGMCCHRVAAGFCQVLHCIAVQMSPWQSAKTVRRSVLRFDEVCCSVLQRVAACCSVLQRVTACCSSDEHATEHDTGAA